MRLESESEARRRRSSGKNYSFEEANNRRKKKRRRRKLLPLAIIGMILLILSLLYCLAAAYFSVHYMPGTYINNELCFNKTVKEMQKKEAEGPNGYSLTVYGRGDVSDLIFAVDIGLKPQFQGEYEAILKEQKGMLWPFYIGKENHYSTNVVVDYSGEYLNQLIDHLAFFDAKNIIPPENAYLSVNAGENGYEIIPEQDGCVPIREQIHREVQAALDAHLTEVTLSDACYEKAEITSENEDLIRERDNLNEYCMVNITYEFGEDKVVVDGNRIKDWLEIEEDGLTLNEEKVREFVNQMAKTHDTFGKPRNFTTHEGEEITVEGGDFGWWMDRATETKELVAAIRNKESGVRVPVYFGTGIVYGNPDIGDSYVEIDLSSQHLWVYEDGEVVIESDFVSGNVKKGNGTPTGTYGITYKEQDATLEGEDYSSAVSYWMPFYGNVGMHDAPWRKDFGGELYLKSGSHGCINLPPKKAKKIYKIVKKHEPVVVYGGKLDPSGKVEAAGKEQVDLIHDLIEKGELNPDGSVKGAAKQETSDEIVETEENPMEFPKEEDSVEDTE